MDSDTPPPGAARSDARPFTAATSRSPETRPALQPVPTHFVFGTWDKGPGASLAAAIKEVRRHASPDSFRGARTGPATPRLVHSPTNPSTCQLEQRALLRYLFYGTPRPASNIATQGRLVANREQPFVRPIRRRALPRREERRDQADHRARAKPAAGERRRRLRRMGSISEAIRSARDYAALKGPPAAEEC